MEILKKRFSWLTERNLLVLLTFLTTATCVFFFIRLSNAFFSAFLLPWATGMIYFSLRKHTIRKNAALIWSCLSIVAFVISGIMTKEICAEWGYGVWLLVFCSFFLLSPCRNMTTHEQHNELLSVAALMITAFMPFAFLCMISVFLARPFNVPFLDYPLGVMGTGDAGSRILIFSHPNITSRFAVVNILLGLYAFCRVQRKSARLYFGLNILLNTMVLSHTQSRTCFIALAAGIAALLFRHIFLRSSKKSWRFLIASVAAIVPFALILVFLNGLYKADVTLAQTVQLADVSIQPIVTRAASQGQFDVFSNGRDTIWLTGFQYLLDNPRYLLFGMGSKNIMERITSSYPIMASFAHLHNSFLECLARYGILYLLSILGLLCAMLVPAIKVLLMPVRYENRGIAFSAVIVGVLLIMSIPEKMLFTNADWSNLLFYFLCGHVLHAAYLQKSEKSAPEENA